MGESGKQRKGGRKAREGRKEGLKRGEKEHGNVEDRQVKKMKNI